MSPHLFLIQFWGKNSNIWPIGKLFELCSMHGQEGGWWDCVFRVNRNRCQFCRLQKCLALGMSRDGEFIHSTTCSHSFIYSFIHTPSSGIAAVIWQCTVSFHHFQLHMTVAFVRSLSPVLILSFIHSFILHSSVTHSCIFVCYLTAQCAQLSFIRIYFRPHTHTNSPQNF